MFDRVLRKHAALNVICIPRDLDEYRRDYAELKGKRVEMYDNTDKVARAYWDFFYGWSTLRNANDYAEHMTFNREVGGRDDFMSYVWQDDGSTPSDLRHYISKLAHKLYDLQMRQDDHAQLPGVFNFAGHVAMADYVLIGDRVNPKARAVQWPFFDPGNSSEHLSKVLHEIGVNDAKLCITNINDHDGLYFAHACIGYGMKPIVLGLDALKRFNKELPRYKEDVAIVWHPSFARRFHHHDDAYHNALRSVLK
jgi:hypothetical protein